MGFRSPQARTEYDRAYQAGLRALPEPDEIHDVPTKFGLVRAYRFGQAEGAPMVLLPGRAGTAVMWRPNIEAFARRHPVYAVDLLGEPGRSTQTASIRDASDQAAWLDAVLAALGLTGVHLVGVSFGGWLACNLAVRSPARVASCSLLDPVATLAGFPAMLLLRTTLTLLPVISRWARPAFLSWISGGIEVPKDDPVAKVINAGIRDFSIALPTPKPFTDEQLRSIRVPVLAIIAGRSVIHNPSAAHARAALIPHVQAELWPTATHAISGECAAEVNERVLRFIASTQASSKH
ncbi:alpha/beta fold hydrolase [Nocardia australiensis]|uniref:alpha/beta fold hydrolase n=1 Tax=Nocardia australiensis TaxID=2887191 RepID=UPI001D13C458|nr:alpha/beta hydrolase [Nocardia australiensis]